MTAMDIETTPADADTGNDLTRHAHCGLCYPPAENPPGSRVPTHCGTTKIIRGDIAPGEIPANACIVCLDPGVQIQHMLKHHPEMLV